VPHKWLLFLDADIYFKNDFLEKSYRQLIKKKIGTATVWFRPKEHKVSLELMMFMYNTYQFVTQPVWPHAIGACIFSKKRVFDKLDGFDTKVTLAEDMDYVRRAIKVDKFMVLTTHVYYSMRRYIKEGKSNMVKKLILTELYRMLNGELRDKKIQDNILEYPMRRDWLKKDKENHKHKSPEITMRKKIKLIIDRKRTK
jgi:GT2 family glycosyltransferase